MNGYGSHCQATAKTLSAIHTITMTDWMARKRPVPRKRAIRSESRANASGSRSNRRRETSGWSSRCRAVISGIRGLLSVVSAVAQVVPPVGGEHVVEQVVDGDGAEQVLLAVHDRPGH